MYGQFSFASLLAHSNKSPRLILIYQVVEVNGSTGTINHFGERVRGGQYTLDGEFLVCPTLFYVRAQLFVKVGPRPRAPWFRTHCLGHGPSVLVWGPVI